MKGVVRDASGRCVYKFDTPSAPTLLPGETIELRDDIDLIPVDPALLPPPGPDYRAMFAAAATTGAKLDVIAQKLGLV